MPSQPPHRNIEYQFTEANLCQATEDGTYEYLFPMAIEPTLVWTAVKIRAFHATNGVEIVEPCRMSLSLVTDDEHTVSIVGPTSVRGRYEFASPLQGLHRRWNDQPTTGYHLFVKPPSNAADVPVLYITLQGFLQKENPDRSGILIEQGKEYVARIHERDVGDSVWMVGFSEEGLTRYDLQP